MRSRRPTQGPAPGKGSNYFCPREKNVALTIGGGHILRTGHQYNATSFSEPRLKKRTKWKSLAPDKEKKNCWENPLRRPKALVEHPRGTARMKKGGKTGPGSIVCMIMLEKGGKATGGKIFPSTGE